MTQIAIVIPAAGASSRMRGTDKLLEPVAGVPLLRRAASRAVAISDCVMVTLPDRQSPRAAVLHDLGVIMIDVPDAAEGMAASLRTAFEHVPAGISGVMILPADMPDLTEGDLRQVCAVFDASNGQAIVQATGADGTPGHPVIFPSDLLSGFANLTGDAGARSILKANADRVRRVALPGQNALTDLDTPEAWVTWRAVNPEQ
jgi:CTP:molybdopterin cytidylyltransferase MocA